MVSMPVFCAMKVAPQKSAAQHIKKFAIARDISSPVHPKSASSVATIGTDHRFYRFGVPQACLAHAVISKWKRVHKM
jgi:hypothetical protein